MLNRRALFVVNTDWFFLSHRLSLALAMKSAGYEVFVATPDSGKGCMIQSAGLEYIPLPMTRRGVNPIREAKTLLDLIRLFRDIAPNIIHLSTPKAVIYGSLAANFAPSAAVISVISGLGSVFSDSGRVRMLRPMVQMLYRVALCCPKCMAVFQNSDDLRFFVDSKLIAADKTCLIRGSGVECDLYMPTDEPVNGITVMMPARLILDKGVGEFVEAARILKRAHPNVRFALVGEPDEGNPSSVPESCLRKWAEEGTVELWGHRNDMPSVYASTSIVVLPSYREGLPKCLLEAAAAGRPIVASDVPGCREIVIDGVNGLMVPPRNVGALVRAIDRLIVDANLRRKFGMAGRELALEQFDQSIVTSRYLELMPSEGPLQRVDVQHTVADKEPPLLVGQSHSS